MTQRTVVIRVHGRVQGVGYRAFLRAEAKRHDVCGWVRNRCDGTVEAEMTGNTEALEAALAAARRGPPGGNVTEIEITDAQAPDGQGAGDAMTALPTR